MNQRVFSIIEKFVDDPKKKLEIYRFIHCIGNQIHRSQSESSNIAIIPSNESYGHEFWIKKYSGWNKPIYGLVEHGLYLGNNHQKVGDKVEYDLGVILTFGDYRKKIINEAFPGMKVFKIGPRIAYSETDNDYKSEILGLLKGNKRVLTIFPAHSITSLKSKYDIPALYNYAKKICAEFDLDNIFVCLPYGDIEKGLEKDFEKHGCSIVSAGKDSIKFLPRLKAIIEMSTITMSNSLGTNLGYCIYMGKQQILIPQKIEYEGTGFAIETERRNKGSEYDYFYQQETELFASIFDGSSGEIINEKQKEICNYYWGLNDVLSSKEFYNLLSNLDTEYHQK